MKIKLKTLIISILLPLAFGGISGLISKDGMEAFKFLNKPPLSPPGWTFPVVWTVLYIIMGIASYIIFTSKNNEKIKNNALTVYCIQLLFNFFWPIFFFKLSFYYFSFLWLVLLFILIVITTILFRKISKTASYLLLPYLLWVIFAGYLNISIATLN